MTLAPTSPHRTTPPLESGDRLTQQQFHRLYELAADQRHVELIEGTVFMPSPTRSNLHGKPQASIIRWLGGFADRHPEVQLNGQVTIILDGRNEPEPDAVLYLKPEADGQSRLDDKDYIVGAPELVVEISASSASIDLGAKMTAYARNGVREYIVWQTFDDVITWFALRDGDFVPIRPDALGVIHSTVFPGLALDVGAMLAGDMKKVLDIQRAIDSNDTESR